MRLTAGIAVYRDNDLRIMHDQRRFYEGLELKDAITYAASGLNANGRINSHQRRLGVKTLRKSARIMESLYPAIQKKTSFAGIFEITEAVKSEMKGLGDLWSYDTALRIAFNRGEKYYPQSVFIQQAVTKGIKRIFPKMTINNRSLPSSAFPKAIQQLQPYEIENFLCVWGKKK